MDLYDVFDWLELTGVGVAIRESSWLFPVIEAGARYHKSARYDEELAVVTRLAEVGGVRVRFEYRIHRQDEAATLLASGFTEHATLDRDQRPRRIPAQLLERLREASCSE